MATFFSLIKFFMWGIRSIGDRCAYDKNDIRRLPLLRLRNPLIASP